jgi:pilus assembly protein CpaB
MNWKNWIPLVLAIVLGLVAALVAKSSMSRSVAMSPAQPRAVKVVVARGPIAPGQELTAEQLTLGPIAADAPPPGAFTDVASVVGRVANTPMFNGQPVLEDLVAPRGAGTGIQALVPKGMRAITVDVNETTGLAGMLLPGCRVDVVSTLNGASKDDTVAATIVQDVLVQAVGQRLTAATPPTGAGPAHERDAQPVRTVTLMVTPREAEAIELASSMGRIRLVLRGTNDRATAEIVGVTFVELRGNEKERVRMPVVAVTTPVTIPAMRPADPRGVPAGADPFAQDPRTKRTVTLIRGTTKTEVVFELPQKSESDTAMTKTNDEPVEE